MSPRDETVLNQAGFIKGYALFHVPCSVESRFLCSLSHIWIQIPWHDADGSLKAVECCPAACLPVPPAHLPSHPVEAPAPGREKPSTCPKTMVPSGQERWWDEGVPEAGSSTRPQEHVSPDAQISQ